MKSFPLHSPTLHRNDLKNLTKAFQSTWISGSGKYVNLLEKKIKKLNLVKGAVACNSGSAGLFLSLKALGISENEEVIVPTITFVATINSITQNNANPVFMDCDDTFNIDVNKTLKFLNSETFTKNNHTYNKKTKKKIFAVIIVHCFGFPVMMEELSKVCKKKNIFLIEDAAESLGSKYISSKFKNFHTGKIGDIGVISFNANKIITGGSGGVIISNNSNILSKIKYLINQAKNDTVKFIHNNSGYNLTLSNLQCSIIYSQINRIDHILKKKYKIHEYYKSYLNKKKFEIITDHKSIIGNKWLNVVKIKNYNKKNHNQLVKKLIKFNIFSRYVWFPNHLQKPFKKYQKYNITNALNMVFKSICLPSSIDLKEKEIKYICDKINNF